jgi:putative ABC transport system permease protein
VAFAIAVLMVQLVLPIFNQLSNKALSLYYLFDVKLILGYVALFCLTGFLAGFYPALVISSYNPVQTLYNRFTITGKNYLQKGLVVFQFALATLLVMATFIIYSQFAYLTKKELGYDDRNTVIIRKENLTRKEANLFREVLLQNPNIIAVANKNAGRWGTSVKVNGNTEIMISVETIDESYLPLYHIPVVKGRNFSPDFPSDSTHSVLVNETFVKQAGWKDPIGKEVNFWYSDNGKHTVVGVVKDYHYASLSEKIGPQVFTVNPGNAFGLTAIKIRPDTETESLKHIESSFKKIFPFNPYTYRFKDLENLKNYDTEAKWKQMMLFGAILTIFISAIGLFGLTVTSAEKRTKEIGIRKVLGASVTAVATTLSKDFLKLVTIALLIAMPVSWLLTNKWLEKYPYRIEQSWQIFVAGAVLVLLIAVVTVSSQAIKAAIANPVKSLRTE